MLEILCIGVVVLLILLGTIIVMRRLDPILCDLVGYR